MQVNLTVLFSDQKGFRLGLRQNPVNVQQFWAPTPIDETGVALLDVSKVKLFSCSHAVLAMVSLC